MVPFLNIISSLDNLYTMNTTINETLDTHDSGEVKLHVLAQNVGHPDDDADPVVVCGEAPGEDALRGAGLGTVVQQLLVLLSYHLYGEVS